MVRRAWYSNFYVGTELYDLFMEFTMGGYVGWVEHQGYFFCAVPFSTNIQMFQRDAEKRVRELCGLT